MRMPRLVTLLTLILLTAGCAERQPTQPPQAPATTQERFTQSGKASYYARMHHGQRTANGETHDQNALVAAHRSLPFGTPYVGSASEQFGRNSHGHFRRRAGNRASASKFRLQIMRRHS